MKKTMQLLTALSALWIVSCKNIGFDKTKTGMEYKIYQDGKGAPLKKGDYVKFHYKITYKDSLITSSYDFIPGYDQVDSVGRYHDFSEILTKMKIGDSAVCYQLFDSLKSKNQYGVPPYMKAGDKQKMTIKILDAISTGREAAITDYQQEMENFKNRELVKIEKYITQNKINATKVNNNVFVEVLSKGTGLPADSGKLVGIKYTGYNFDGKFFDSNVDSTKQTQKHGLEPYYFISKTEGAIAGMMEGVSVFNQGGKGRIFIPSILAYGPQGNPPAIRPNENLIFDVEIVEVIDAPPRQQMPGMPPGQNPNR